MNTFRKICDDPSNMAELEHNHAYIKDGEAWYRDFEREISVRNLLREICSKHAAPADADEMDDETLEEALVDSLAFGTDELEGIFSMFYMSLCGLANVRSWLECYEVHGLPTTIQPEVLEQAVEKYGKNAQVDMAIEEMSELTKALLKHRRATLKMDFDKCEETARDISEEMADVIIMLTQLQIIFGNRQEVQRKIGEKVARLDERLTGEKKAQPENCIYGHGSCCWPIEECESCPNNEIRREEAAKIGNR